jgi:hypothetical protein
MARMAVKVLGLLPGLLGPAGQVAQLGHRHSQASRAHAHAFAEGRNNNRIQALIDSPP